MEHFMLLCGLLFLFLLLARQLKSTVFVFAIWILFAGICGNSLVVALNNNRMPVFMANMSVENQIALSESVRHQIGTAQTKMKVLADTIFLEKYGYIVSVGDIAIFFAMFIPLFFLIKSLRKTRHSFFTNNLPVSYFTVAGAMVTSWAVAFVVFCV